MKMIFFWLLFGIFAVLFIIQMIIAIPLLKKDTSPEKKSSRQPIIRILNSLMIVFAGIEVAIGIGAFYSGIAISAVGFLNLLLSVMKNTRKKSKKSIGITLGIIGIIISAMWFLFGILAFILGQSV